jgi:hypothetical protein
MSQRQVTGQRSRRIRVVRRKKSSTSLPPLDLRTPSGRRVLPY